MEKTRPVNRKPPLHAEHERRPRRPGGVYSQKAVRSLLGLNPTTVETVLKPVCGPPVGPRGTGARSGPLSPRLVPWRSYCPFIPSDDSIHGSPWRRGNNISHVISIIPPHQLLRASTCESQASACVAVRKKRLNSCARFVSVRLRSKMRQTAAHFKPSNLCLIIRRI